MAIGELNTPRPDYEARRSAAAAVATAMAVLLIVILGALGAPARLALLGGLGVLGLGLLTRPRAATLLFVAVLYLNLPVIAVRFHGADPLIVAAAPLLLGIPLMSYVVIRREAIVVTRTLGWMIAYTAVLLLSTIFAADVESALGSTATFLTEGLILYFLLTNAVRSIGTLRGVVLVLLLIGTFLGSLSLFQQVTGTFENQYWGLAQTKEADPLEPSDPGDISRLSGPIGSKNRYAQAMLVLLPLSLFAYVTGRARWHRALAIVSGFAILSGMILTYSRGAALTLGVLLLLTVLLRYIRARTAIAGGVALVIGLFVFAPNYAERLESIGEVTALVSETQQVEDNAILGRATSNLAALNVFADHPLLGVGPGRYQADFSQEYANDLGLRHFTSNRRAHNLYLEIAADTGIPGIITFMGILGATLTGLWRARRTWLLRKPAYAHLATALFLSVAGYMLTGFFLHIAYMRYFWLLIAVANSAIWVLHREARAAEQEGTQAVQPAGAG